MWPPQRNNAPMWDCARKRRRSNRIGDQRCGAASLERITQQLVASHSGSRTSEFLRTKSTIVSRRLRLTFSVESCLLSASYCSAWQPLVVNV
ncbi:hypothetical protein LSAT2_031771 [Lamellibrachia satsuma]|nr:hypothetical protein LSAT2_031771 [Lamellibrachia satsuma]